MGTGERQRRNLPAQWQELNPTRDSCIKSLEHNKVLQF